MRRNSRHLPIIGLWLLVLVGCDGAENSLSGSIGSTHPLAFETVTLRQLDTSYVVAYLKGNQTATRLAYTPSQRDRPIPEQTITLDFGQGGNAGLSRATSDGLSFPPPKSGTLTFSTEVVEGSVVRGRFGVEFNSGQTLSGLFSSTLVLAER